MQRRIILAATALAAALIVPTLASATDKQAGTGDRAVPEAWQNRDHGGNTSTQNQMAVGGQGPNSSTLGQIGGAPSTVGQIGGSTPTGQGVGSTPTGIGGTGETGGHEPIESAIACGPIKKSKTPKDETAHEKKAPTLPKSDAGDPADDEANLEAELREQQELMDRLTDLLNQMQQRHNDAIRSAAGG